MGRLLAFLNAIILVAAACGASVPTGGGDAPKEPIKIGGIFDLSGATSDVGVPYADGVKDYVAFVNASGGVNGRKITLVSDDYAYQIPRAEELYNRLVTQESVVAIMGWGTGDTIAMTPKITKDKLPFMSASYSADLVADVAKTPYNFMIGQTYSDQARLVLKYIKDNWKGTSPPKVSLAYGDNAFGKSPIEDAKKYMQENGITNTSDVVMPAGVLDLSPQLLSVKAQTPDFLLMQNTSAPVAVAAKSAKTAGLDKTVLATLNWGYGEKTIELAGAAAEGMLGVAPFVGLSDEAPGLKEIRDWNDKSGKDWKKQPVNYVQGWLTMKVMVEGLRRVQGELTGEKLKAALEALSAYDTGGIADKITFSSKSHKGALAARVFKVQGGKWVRILDLTAASTR
jgi:branched-chain amino acid transport system substrate-binding protein